MQRSSLPVGLGTLKKWREEKCSLKDTLPYQRHSGMWNNITQSNLVRSLLADSYVPAIVLLKDKAGEDDKGKSISEYQILDGLQRLTTLFSFMNGEFALHSATPEVEVDGTPYDLAGCTFDDLSDECKDAITGYRFTVQCIENYTHEEAENLFFDLNSGVALSTIQKSKAKMGVELIQFLNELLREDFFTQGINITEKQARSEDDLCTLLQCMLLLDNLYEDREYKNISTATCLSYAASLRNSYSEEKRERLRGLVKYLSEAFSQKNKFLRKNNIPIVMVCALFAMEQDIGNYKFRAFINDFAGTVNPAYDEASGSGNVRADKVQMRLRVLFLEMCKYFSLDAESIGKPFGSEIPLYLETKEDVESEGVTEPEERAESDGVTEPEEILPVSEDDTEEAVLDDTAEEELVDEEGDEYDVEIDEPLNDDLDPNDTSGEEEDAGDAVGTHAGLVGYDQE